MVSLLNSSVITICNLLILYQCQHCNIIFECYVITDKMQTLKELNLPHWSQRSPIYSTIIPAIPGTDLALNQFLKGISPSYQDPGKHKTVCILYPSLYCIISLLSKITALYKQNVQIYLVYFFFLAPKEIIKNIK